MPDKMNFLLIALAFNYLHISLTSKNIFADFYVISVDFLIRANKECECSYQNAKNGQLSQL